MYNLTDRQTILFANTMMLEDFSTAHEVMQKLIIEQLTLVPSMSQEDMAKKFASLAGAQAMLNLFTDAEIEYNEKVKPKGD